jgi:enoyl-CoA hydratase
VIATVLAVQLQPDLSPLETIHFERRDDLLFVTIDHPTSSLNAVDEALHDDFHELFRRLKLEHESRAIVLSGGTKRAFSAGGDFNWFPALRTPAALDPLRRAAKQIIWDLLEVDVPIVCALNGSAAGLGASIALLCDMIVMSERAVIVDPHVNVGLVAGDGGAAVWPLLVGPLAAKRHLLLGDPLTADEALRLGVAVEVCAPDAVMERAVAWARRIAAQPPLAVRGTKTAVNAQLKRALLDSFDLSTALEIPCFLSDDHVEAVDAMQQHRAPRFVGH